MLGKRGRPSCRAPVSGRPSCDAHNSVVPVALDLIVDVTLAITRQQHCRSAVADCSLAEAAASRELLLIVAERRCRCLAGRH